MFLVTIRIVPVGSPSTLEAENISANGLYLVVMPAGFIKPILLNSTLYADGSVLNGLNVMSACAITSSWRLLTATAADLLTVNFYITVFHDGTFPNKSQLNPKQTLHRPSQTITEKLVNGRPHQTSPQLDDPCLPKSSFDSPENIIKFRQFPHLIT
jgi:hypothetical protein